MRGERLLKEYTELTTQVKKLKELKESQNSITRIEIGNFTYYLDDLIDAKERLAVIYNFMLGAITTGKIKEEIVNKYVLNKKEE